MTEDKFSVVFENVQKVLVVMAHPDDAEVFCGGTIARLIASGRDVRVVKVTSGNRGSRDNDYSMESLANERSHEDMNACNILGVTDENSIHLGVNDGEVENSMEVIGKIAKEIRVFKPDLVITHNPEDIIIHFAKGENWVNHRDHRNTGKSTIDAAYPYSRDNLFFPEQLTDGVTPHSVSQFLIADYYNHPDSVDIDITEFMEKKTKALSAHTSQFTSEKAEELISFMTSREGEEGKFERFRFVKAD